MYILTIQGCHRRRMGITFHFATAQSIMQRVAMLVLAIAASTAFGRECDTTDFSPYTTQWLQCRLAANLPVTPTGTDMLNACKFNDCVVWYKQIAKLSCTLNGSPTTELGTMCTPLTSPPTTTPKPATTTPKPATTTPKPAVTPSVAPATTTRKPSGGGDVPCVDTDYAPLSAIFKTCRSDSGIVNLTKTNLPVYCSYASCVTYVRSYATLTCTEDGDPVSMIATVCDPYIKDTPTTTKATSGGSAGSECTANDTPTSFPKQLQSCLYVAGLTAVPTSLSGLVGLCSFNDCTLALKMYAGLTCTVQGLPASVVATACVGATTAKPTATIEAPTSSVAPTTTKPLVISTTSATVVGSYVVVAVVALLL
ncbi:hypothetical protein DYB35_002967 [Aphanomyces astaci]|uniref:Uncharacterized protein n=2 Tax=Aphanomyces astaci TaxID=112090 RepID=A0A418DKH3_APHAT|nr:hypothetical protein DYB35_002967 [Aphanomyces astaci]